jgi:hypothetical protein
MSPHLNFLQGLVAFNPKTVGMDGSKRSLQIDERFFAMQVMVCCSPLEPLKILLQVPISLYDLSGTLISSN